jgi:anti-sigma B factor antagonist
MLVTTETRQAGDVTIVDVTGDVKWGPSASSLSGAIRRLATDGHQRLLLNLAEISYIDSSGLGELVTGLTVVAKQGGALKLLKPSERVQAVLRITSLDTLFQVFDDEEAAVRSFASKA